ncbi:hypothetical protein KC345_g68 [Hortaea werneckii]|nr:hypothetical protein KC345_g68 [Hortaea werneckii]
MHEQSFRLHAALFSGASFESLEHQKWEDMAMSPLHGGYPPLIYLPGPSLPRSEFRSVVRSTSFDGCDTDLTSLSREGSPGLEGGSSCDSAPLLTARWGGSGLREVRRPLASASSQLHFGLLSGIRHDLGHVISRVLRRWHSQIPWFRVFKVALGPAGGIYVRRNNVPLPHSARRIESDKPGPSVQSSGNAVSCFALYILGKMYMLYY